MALLSGGQRDLTPPKFLSSIPVNASVNFKGKTIELSFDEFVKVSDLANQLVITPQTKEMPLVEARGKKVVIKFNEELLPNATYRLFFGNAIMDMHESNVLTNFEFVFSTGSFIDSLKLSGTVKNSFNLKPEKDVLIGLYDANENDSVIFQKKPLYFSKTELSGNFKLSYLPKSNFKAFAFTDKNKNLMYDGGEEMADFQDQLVQIPSDSIINFKIFKEESHKKFIKRSYSPYYGLAYVIYNKTLLNQVEAFEKSQSELISFRPTENDTCKIYYYNVYDSLKLIIKHSENDITDTVRIGVSTKELADKLIKDKKLSFDMKLEPLDGGKLMFNKKPIIAFNRWMDESKMDLSKVRIVSKTDSLISKTPLTTVIASDKIEIGNTFKPNTEYQLIVNRSAFADRSGIESDSVKLSFKTTARDDYATLNLKLFFPKKENYIIQLLNAQDAVMAEQFIELSLTSSAEQMLHYSFLLPGNYFVKVIEDVNHNKKWDTGKIIGQKHGENIYFNAQPIKLMADWDAEIEWKIND